MKKLIKITGISEGFLTLYFIILFIGIGLLFKNKVVEWYLYLFMIPVSLITTFVLIIIHMIIHYAILDIPDEIKKSQMKELNILLNDLIKENKELKEQIKQLKSNEQ